MVAKESVTLAAPQVVPVGRIQSPDVGIEHLEMASPVGELNLGQVLALRAAKPA